MDSKKPLYKSIAFWMVVLFLLYSTLGFFAVPYFIKKELTQLSHHQLNSELYVEKISFNPYTISLEVNDIRLTDKDKTTWFSLNKAHANLHLWSSLFSELSLASVNLEKPFYHLKMVASDSEASLQYPNVSNTNQETTQESTHNSSNFIINIDDIVINEGAITYENESTKKTVDLKLKEIAFNNSQFTTANRNNNFNLSFVTNSQATATITGTYNISTLDFDLQWHLKNWPTTKIFDFVSDENNTFLGFSNNKGLINANGTTSLKNQQSSLPILNVEKLELTNVDVVNKEPQQPQLNVGQLIINNTQINLEKQSLTIAEIDLRNNHFELSIDDQFQVILPETPDSKTDDDSETDASNWSYLIQKVNLEDQLLLLNKSKASQVYKNTIKLQQATLENITNTNNTPITMAINMQTNDQGDINIDGQLTTEPLLGQYDISAADVNLSSWQAWVPEQINMSIESGLLSAQQKLKLSDNGVNSSGNIDLDKLQILDHNKQDLIGLNAMKVTEAHIDSENKKIQLDKITLDQAQAILSVDDKQQLNVNGLITNDINEENNTNPLPSEEQDWIIEIKEIDFINAQTTLTDKSVEPVYHTELSQLNGQIKGLSSDNLSKADVDLKAVLDTYSKITISGQINPLSNQTYTDLSIDIKELDLQNFNSYSGKFLGFPINRGKADLTFKYKLNQNELIGVNDLTFKQLQFGNKNNSKDAINLPLKLAVNLLTDGQGIMKIDLPVKGNIDDPEFSYGGLVFKAFFKLITGIVASPFKLLGKLIPGGAELDLSGVNFKAGTLELMDGEEQKLTAMKQIIAKRPAILLELTGLTNQYEDKKALRKKALLTTLGITQELDFTQENIQLAIEKLFIVEVSQEKWDDLASKSIKDEQLDKVQLSENAYKELLAQQNIDDQYIILAKQRAEFIQKELIETHEIVSDKIFLKPSEESTDMNPQVKFGIGN